MPSNLYPDREVHSYLTRRFVVATVREELTRLGMLGRIADAAPHLDDEICVDVDGVMLHAHDSDSKAPGRLFHHCGGLCLFAWPCCGRSGAKREPYPLQIGVAVVLRDDGRDRVIAIVLSG